MSKFVVGFQYGYGLLEDMFDEVGGEVTSYCSKVVGQGVGG